MFLNEKEEILKKNEKKQSESFAGLRKSRIFAPHLEKCSFEKGYRRQ